MPENLPAKVSDGKQFTRIVGLSDKIVLPRCGKVRLGERRTKGAGGPEYPADLTYFRFDDGMLDRYPKIAELYRNPEGTIEPQELDIMLPVEDEAVIFPQALRFYGKSRGLRCIGNGEHAQRYLCDKCRTMDCRCEAPAMIRAPWKCKCELYDRGDCSERASLMFILPRITWEACWQLDTGSIHNIIHINSALRFIRAVVGRLSLVPLKLRRVPAELTYQGKKRKHWLLSLGFDGDAAAVARIRRELPDRTAVPATQYDLPAPTLEGDEDEPRVVYDDDVAQPPSAGNASNVAQPPSAGNVSASAGVAQPPSAVTPDPVINTPPPSGPKPPPAAVGPIEADKIIALRRQLHLETAAEFAEWRESNGIQADAGTSPGAAEITAELQRSLEHVLAMPHQEYVDAVTEIEAWLQDAPQPQEIVFRDYIERIHLKRTAVIGKLKPPDLAALLRYVRANPTAAA